MKVARPVRRAGRRNPPVERLAGRCGPTPTHTSAPAGLALSGLGDRSRIPPAARLLDGRPHAHRPRRRRPHHGRRHRGGSPPESSSTVTGAASTTRATTASSSPTSGWSSPSPHRGLLGQLGDRVRSGHRSSVSWCTDTGSRTGPPPDGRSSPGSTATTSYGSTRACATSHPSNGREPIPSTPGRQGG